MLDMSNTNRYNHAQHSVSPTLELPLVNLDGQGRKKFQTDSRCLVIGICVRIKLVYMRFISELQKRGFWKTGLFQKTPQRFLLVINNPTARIHRRKEMNELILTDYLTLFHGCLGRFLRPFEISTIEFISYYCKEYLMFADVLF